MKLDEKKCIPCEGGLEPLTEEKAKKYLTNLNNEWKLSEDSKSIERTYSRKNHYELSSLINIIIAISHSEDHHPEITFTYNTAKVKYFTYAIDGLSENDFICAAKIDKVLSI
tara:strand:- start:2537 stop:2872 length:336 start_codon:yes stop_codon:yes gene_type:complete